MYLITAWQYPPRLGMLFYILSLLGSIRRGLLFYILSRLGSICRGLACNSISYPALAASAEAWHAILYPPWQYPPRLGMLFYILEAQVEQTETCRRAGSERYLVNLKEVLDFAKWQRILDWPARQICKKNLSKISQK